MFQSYLIKTTLIALTLIVLTSAPTRAQSYTPDPVRVTETGIQTIQVNWAAVINASEYRVWLNGDHVKTVLPGQPLSHTLYGLPRGSVARVQVTAKRGRVWFNSQVIFFQLDIETDLGNPLASMFTTQHFGFTNHVGTQGHLGEDFRAQTPTDTFSIGRGKVTQAKDFKGGWGRVIIIEHLVRMNQSVQKVYSMYAHMSQVNVTPGQWLNKGQVIGKTGDEDLKWTPHLHFEIRTGATAWSDAGPGYSGYNFSGNSINFAGLTYYRPSWFISNF